MEKISDESLDHSKSELKETLTDLIGFEFKKLWLTIKGLTLQPAKTIKAYCDGERKKFVSPITYFLLCASVSYFITSQSGIDERSKKMGKQIASETFSISEPKQDSGYLRLYIKKWGLEKGTANSLERKEAQASVEAFLESQNGRLLMGLPASLLLFWLFFRKFKRFSQNLFFFLYTDAQGSLLTLPLLLVLPVYSGTFALMTITLVGTLFSVLYFLFVAKHFYDEIDSSNFWWRIITYILSSILASMIWISFIGFATEAFLGWYYWYF